MAVPQHMVTQPTHHHFSCLDQAASKARLIFPLGLWDPLFL